MEFTAAEAWSRILEHVRTLLPDQTYRTWLEKTEPLALSQDRLAVGTSSEFAAEWIESKHGKLLNEVAARLLGQPITISFQYHPNGTPDNSALGHIVQPVPERAPLSPRSPTSVPQPVPPMPPRPPPGARRPRRRSRRASGSATWATSASRTTSRMAPSATAAPASLRIST